MTFFQLVVWWVMVYAPFGFEAEVTVSCPTPECEIVRFTVDNEVYVWNKKQVEEEMKDSFRAQCKEPHEI